MQAVNSKQRNKQDQENKKLMILIENNKNTFYQKFYITYT